MTEMRTLLVVDDEGDMLDFLERALRGYGRVLRAQSGAEALALLAENPVDVIVTDQKMPRMTGIELLAEVSRRGVDCVKVILSGYAEAAEARAAALRCGVHQYILKPVDSGRLRELIDEAFANRSAGRLADLEGAR